jgi:succinate dehydrogenase / fumarate reductase membrane anchor subunit
MVSNASALGRNGVHDFILVRATAIVLTLYIIYMVGFSPPPVKFHGKSGRAFSPPRSLKSSPCWLSFPF